MAGQLYLCPVCGCPDIEAEKTSLVLPAKERAVHCPNCKWTGMLSDAAGLLTTENVYDSTAILNLLLYTTMKHAAGPIAQALIFVGLLERNDQAGIDLVMRAAVEGLVREAFSAAAAHAAEVEGLVPVAVPFCSECGGRGWVGDAPGDEPAMCPRCGGQGNTQGAS